MTKVSFVAIRRSDMSYQQKRFYLFNCDNTYTLETVEKLLLEAGDKLWLQNLG